MSCAAPAERVNELLLAHRREVATRTDRLFAGLMGFQWLLAIVLALWISPLAWAGDTSWPHRHVAAAALLGGAASVLPIALALLRPGAVVTRHVIGAGQMVMGSLLIHLTGGRIETHFHVFGSLAFLAFYRDWRVIGTASAVVAVDHLLRGIYWPESVFGVVAASPWRWLEHVGWVGLCDAFLIRSSWLSLQEMRQVAERRAALEHLNESIERCVQQRTAELADSEARKAAILDSALDAILTVDGDLRITEFNPAAERLFGRARAAVLQTPFNGLVTLAGRGPAALRDRLMIAPASLIGHRVEGEGHPTGGASFPAELAITAVRTGGPEAYAIHVRDITVSKRALETTRRAAEAAEAASRAKSEFLANMSHEMRTPLNGILGMAALTLETPLQPEQREYLEAVTTSGESLLAVIDELLDFSRIEAGRLDLTPVVFAPRDVIADQFAVVAPRAADKGLELVLRVRPDVPCFLRGDAQRFGQILLNLLGNAVKFTEHGEVTVTVQPAAPTAAGRYQLQVAVHDTGIGIAPDRRDAVFDPFVQADGSTTRRYGGTGLGLTIARRLVERMDGRIWLDSVVGAGTTVCFDVALAAVPAAERPTAGPPAAGSPAAALHGRRALVVDDHAGSRAALVETLAAAGLRCTTAADGDEALAALAAAAPMDPFAVMLLDDTLPGTGGITLARRLCGDARRHGTTAPPIVLLSRSDHAAAAVAARDLSIAHLRKPVRHAALHRAIATAVEPAAAPAATVTAAAADASETAPPGRARVLVAEDNAANQRLIGHLLRKRGYQVVVTGDGEAALELLARERFDLALLDIRMPGRSGLEVTQAVRERERQAGGHLPLVALTAHALPGHRERFLAAGLDDYVAKPFDATELFATIERALGTAPR